MNSMSEPHANFCAEKRELGFYPNDVTFPSSYLIGLVYMKKETAFDSYWGNGGDQSLSMRFRLRIFTFPPHSFRRWGGCESREPYTFRRAKFAPGDFLLITLVRLRGNSDDRIMGRIRMSECTISARRKVYRSVDSYGDQTLVTIGVCLPNSGYFCIQITQVPVVTTIGAGAKLPFFYQSRCSPAI